MSILIMYSILYIYISRKFIKMTMYNINFTSKIVVKKKWLKLQYTTKYILYKSLKLYNIHIGALISYIHSFSY